jgi:hypothetical protein
MYIIIILGTWGSRKKIVWHSYYWFISHKVHWDSISYFNTFFDRQFHIMAWCLNWASTWRCLPSSWLVSRQVDYLKCQFGKSTKKRLPQLKSTQLYYSTAHQPPEARKQGNLNFPQIVCFVGLGQLDCFFRQVDHLIPVWFGQVDRFPVKLTGLKVVSPCARLKIYFCLKWFLSCIWVLRKSPSPLKRCDSRNLILPTFDPVNLTWSSWRFFGQLDGFAVNLTGYHFQGIYIYIKPKQ